MPQLLQVINSMVGLGASHSCASGSQPRAVLPEVRILAGPTDDDGPPTVTFDVASQSAGEGAGTAVIGLTIVAFGTSLPELAAALTSALRKEDDLAIGTVIGSNMFNILGVLGIAATISPVHVDELMLKQDFPVMFLLTVLLFFMAYGISGPGRISRNSGGLLLAIYCCYQVLVWITAARIVA